MALFFERWAKIIIIEATTGQALQSVNSMIALPNFRVGNGGFTETSMQSFFDRCIFPMLQTHKAELALLDFAQWKTLMRAMVTNGFVNFDNAKTIRIKFLIHLDETFPVIEEAIKEGGDPFTLIDFHVIVMKEIHRLKEAKVFVSGYEAPQVEDKVRAPSNTLAAFQQPTEKDRGGKGNLSDRCYGCHRKGHSGDKCFRSGEAGFNSDKDISWPESTNGKLLRQMGYQVLGGNEEPAKRNHDNAGKAPFWKRQREGKHSRECINEHHYCDSIVNRSERVR
jgi:hypothetical protein